MLTSSRRYSLSTISTPAAQQASSRKIIWKHQIKVLFHTAQLDVLFHIIVSRFIFQKYCILTYTFRMFSSVKSDRIGSLSSFRGHKNKFPSLTPSEPRYSVHTYCERLAQKQTSRAREFGDVYSCVFRPKTACLTAY